MTAEITLEPGALDITMRTGNDLSFDVDFGIDLTSYTYVAYLVPVTAGSTEIAITITPIDVSLGQLHFFISRSSVASMRLLSNKHKWYFNWTVGGFTRTVLAGYFNLTSK